MFKKETTVSKYLIDKLQKIGIEDIFGIPGDYVVKFFSVLENSPLNIVGSSSEQGAAFAADAYARINGLSALCVTFSVGGLNTINAVAGAYAEKAPIIVISGAPGVKEHEAGYLLHHSIRDINSQLNMFNEVTVASARLDNPQTAPYEINRVIDACIRYKRPVYIELPRDMVDEKCPVPPEVNTEDVEVNENSLKEALSEAAEMLNNAKKPVVIGGVEIRRYGLEKEFEEFLDKTGYPYATTILGKGIIHESHPQFIGVFMGKLGDEKVRAYIEESDCILMMGALITDTNMGTSQLDASRTIYASADQLCIRHHYYKDIDLKTYIKELKNVLNENQYSLPVEKPEVSEAETNGEDNLTIIRFFEKLNGYLPENSLVICDVGDSLFGSAELKLPKNSGYLGPAYYTSMGYAIPASLGSQIKSNIYHKPFVIVGDGAFQMTGHEISSLVRYGIKPIIFVLNNKGYTTQRFLKDGKFNDILNWNYHLVPQIYGAGLGFSVETENELDDAVEKGLQNKESYTIINVHLDKYDKSRTLHRLTSIFSKRV